MMHSKDVLPAELIPEIAQHILARNEAENAAKAYAEPVEAVVLFADLSGFSTLGAELVSKSDRGAEELRKLINTIFERVVGLIGNHGGSVLHYAGDAVTAAWPCQQGDRTANAGEAIHCGLAIQKACETLSAELDVELGMRASLTHGTLWAVHAPQTDIGPQLIFCGSVLTAPADGAESQTGVYLTGPLFSSTKNMLDESAQYQREGAGARVLAFRQARADHTPATGSLSSNGEQYVQSSLRDLLQHASSEWLAEFRTVNVLFARFPNFAFNGPQNMENSVTLLSGAIAAISEFGGTLIQFCTDDKGLVLLAGWGLASSSFENGAERALGAAIRLREAAESAGQAAECAVTQGKVFAGLVGAHPLYQYVMVGDAVNRAARMAVISKSPLVFDAAVGDAAARRYASVESEQIRLKGQNEPVPVYTLAAERLSGVSHQGKLVGRIEERDRLHNICAEYAKGQPVNIEIIGDAGLGKSRLAAWFEKQLGEASVSSLRMNADSLRQTSGFVPWKQVFETLLGLPENCTAEQCETIVLEKLADDAQSSSLIPLLSPVLPFSIPDTAFTANLSGAGRAESTHNVMLALLKASLAGRGGEGDVIVLLIEDAHWLDSASWQLAEAAERAIPGLCLLIVTRPLDMDNLPTETRRLFEEGAAEIFKLGPLSPEDTAELVSQTLSVREAAPEIVRVVFGEAEGHPLYTTALSLSLHDRGLIRIEGGYAHLLLGESGLSHISFPDSVEGVITERISALPSARQLSLKAASVLGRTFELGMLAEIHPTQVPVETLRSEMNDIVSTGLMEPVDSKSDTYRFHHAIIVDGAYRMLTTDQCRKLHLSAGEFAEKLALTGNGEPDQSALSIMAYHFEQAGDFERALDYLTRAASAAHTSYNNVEAVDFLTRALIIAEGGQGPTVKPNVIGAWKYQIAEALRALGQYQRSEDFLRQSATILDRAPPASGWQATKALVQGYANFRMRPHRTAQPEETRQPILIAAAANMTLSEIHYELNKVPFALGEILRGANLAREAGGDSATLAKLYMGMALISTVLPWALDGEFLQRESLAMADRLDDPAVTSWVYMVSGNYEIGKGGWEASDRHLKYACEVGERCGERKNLESALSSLGNLKRNEGLFEEAKGWSDLTLAASRDRGVVHQIIWSHNGRTRDLLCLSRIDEAREEVATLERLLDDPTKRGDANDNNNLVRLYGRAFCALDDGDEKTARQSLDEIMSIVARTKRPQVYMLQNVDYYSDIIWNLWHRGQRDKQLLAHQALVVKSGKKVAKQYHIGLPMAELANGDGAWYRGDKEKAAKHWLASATAARERGMRYNAGHALFRLHETGLADKSDPAQDWRGLVEELKIPRPVLWSMDGSAASA